MSADYAIVLRLKGRCCVVVGGGAIAQRKIESLVACQGQVVVVSPVLVPALERWVAEGRIHHRAKAFQPADLEGALLVIAATNDPAVNEQVAAAAEARGLLVNVVDSPEIGNFHVPATLRRGSLMVAISTGGRSPFLARRIREELEGRFGPEYAAFLELVGELRPVVRERIESFEARQKVWARMVDSPALALIRAGNRDAARERLIQCIF